MLPNVLNLAAAGGMELARASDMITDTQTAFGISLDRTTQMVDEMAKAASTGNTSVEQLGDAFLKVGGLAQELNGGFISLAGGSKTSVDGVQELEIALTAMANAGIKGDEAGTHMRNMLLKLSSPTADGVKQLKALGVTVFDNQGKMRSLSDIFGDFSNKLGKLSQEKKLSAISDLFNARDIATAEALLGAVNEDWNQIGEAILNAQGAAQQMAETQLDNLAGDITYFKSALEGLEISISDNLTPQLRGAVQFGTQALDTLHNALNAGGFEGMAEAVGDVLADCLTEAANAAPRFIETATMMAQGMVRGLRDNAPALTGAVAELLTSAVTSFFSFYADFWNTGAMLCGQLLPRPRLRASQTALLRNSRPYFQRRRESGRRF